MCVFFYIYLEILRYAIIGNVENFLFSVKSRVSVHANEELINRQGPDKVRVKCEWWVVVVENERYNTLGRYRAVVFFSFFVRAGLLLQNRLNNLCVVGKGHFPR